MNKKYMLVVFGLMVLTMIFISIEKLFKDEAPKNENIKEELASKNNVINAVFYNKSNEQVSASFSDDSVTFNYNKLGTVTLKQAISASGARYANTDESIVFWNKGDNVTIYENNSIVFDGSTVKPEIKTEIPKAKLPADSNPPASESSIQDVSWVWQKTIMNDDSIVTPKKEGVFSLLLKKDGNVALKTDCNGGFGEYKIGSDGVMTFGPLASTMMYCEGSQESVYTKALSNVSRYMLDSSGNLVLLLKNDSGSMLFKK